jgi:hypothetical protein
VLEQPVDHTQQSEWIGTMIRVFSGRNDCGGKTATGVRLLQMSMIAATRSSMLHQNANLNWVQLFSSSMFYFALRSCDGKLMSPAV